jgi:hypothetical protein
VQDVGLELEEKVVDEPRSSSLMRLRLRLRLEELRGLPIVGKSHSIVKTKPAEDSGKYVEHIL